MKFELTILGSGSAVPTIHRNSTAQVLNVLERYFLIDCGEATQHQLRRFKVPYTKINHIFISHLHGDHFFGLIGYLSTLSLQGRRGEMHIYADSRLKDILYSTFKIMKSRLQYKLIFHDLTREKTIIFEDNVVNVTSIPLKHHNEAPSWGFIFREKERERNIIKEMAKAWDVPIAQMQYIKKGADFIAKDGTIVPNSRLTRPGATSRSYAFITDTLFKEEYSEHIKGVDLLYHESTYSKEEINLAHETKHSTSEEAAKMAKLAGAKKLLLGHFSPRYKNVDFFENEAKEIFKNSFICHDGDIFDIELIK